MFFYMPATKLIYFSRKSVQKITVVTDKYHSTVKLTDRLFQHILRAHIQMVGRFIENQEVYRLKQKLNHRQTGTFSTGKYFHFLIRGFTAKHEGSQYIPYFQTYIPRCHTVNRIKYRQIFVQHLCLILGKISDLHIMPDCQFTVEVNLTHDTFHQGRLTFTVLADKSDLLSPIDSQIDVVENDMVAIRFAYILTNHRIITATAGRRKFQT